MSKTDGSRNNRRLTFSDAKSHCANVTRLANATLRHFSESSEHSWNSLWRRSASFLHTLKILINVFNSCSPGVPAETRKLSEDLLYSLFNKRLSHSAVWINLARWWEFQHWCASTANVIKTRNRLQWLGFPAHTMFTFQILDCVHWEFQWGTAIHEKLRETRWCLEVETEILHVLPAYYVY